MLKSFRRQAGLTSAALLRPPSNPSFAAATVRRLRLEAPPASGASLLSSSDVGGILLPAWQIAALTALSFHGRLTRAFYGSTLPARARLGWPSGRNAQRKYRFVEETHDRSHHAAPCQCRHRRGPDLAGARADAGLRAKWRRTDQDRLQHGADRRARRGRPAGAARHPDLGGRNQCQGRPARSAREAHLLR
jgi:hypothetical protein